MQDEGNMPVLAIYDFRSKQEYIYRTNRMREITGASELIAGMYGRFLNEAVNGLTIRDDWRLPRAKEPIVDGLPIFEDGEAGFVVYEGGGNLLVLYRDWNTYRAANRRFSRIVLEEAYGLKMIAAAVEWQKPANDNFDMPFEWNRQRVYAELDRVKRMEDAGAPCNVLPYTQVDRATSQPIVSKWSGVPSEQTAEGRCKMTAFEALDRIRKGEGRFIDDLGTKKGEDSLVAVLYFDGNSIGERVKTAVADGLAAGKSEVAAMREFSLALHEALVNKTKASMVRAISELDESYQGYRIIVDHGDEVTLICNAHAAPFALDAYFKAIEGTGYHACAGVAFCHSHAPFAEVYRIAEECCESGKRRNRAAQRAAMNGREGQDALDAARRADANYVDMHFCRAGITGSLEQIRAAQEGAYTARPYRMDTEYQAFLKIGTLLEQSRVSRSDLKQLNRAMLRGESWYVLEYERLRAKDLHAMRCVEALVEELCSDESGRTVDLRHAAMRLLFDATSFVDLYDLRFKDKEADHGVEG